MLAFVQSALVEWTKWVNYISATDDRDQEQVAS